MNAENCPRCGRLFRKIVSPVCPMCEKEEEEKFQELRLYLEDNPRASISECSEATDVPAKRILRYIREGRLVVPEGMAGLLKCAKCGKDILGGTYCGSCSKKMAQNLANSLVGNPTMSKKSTGFHIGDKK